MSLDESYLNTSWGENPLSDINLWVPPQRFHGAHAQEVRIGFRSLSAPPPVLKSSGLFCRSVHEIKTEYAMTVNSWRCSMSRRIDKREMELLRSLADFRMLTFTQLNVLSAKSPRTIRRWMKQLVNDGLAEALPVSISQGRGRPEGVFGVGDEGLALLRSEGTLHKAAEFDQVGGQALIHQVGHQILMNWCRIHLIHLTRSSPRLVCSFLSSNSPFNLDRDLTGPVVRDFAPAPDGADLEEKSGFVPDGVFILTDSDKAKSLLFFLEVDMDSEPLDSSEPGRAHILKKIETYQSYFESERYKRYEDTWHVKLNGFRLLFVTPSPRRMTSLCRMVRSTPPSDFIWATCQDSILAEGISGNIWARGGKHDNDPQSILGGLARKAPIPELQA